MIEPNIKKNHKIVLAKSKYFDGQVQVQVQVLHSAKLQVQIQIYIYIT